MKKTLLLILMMLFMLSFAASAQEGDTLWELTETFTVTDLRIQFDYPEGWVWDTQNAIFIAENEDDLEALTDEDDATAPEGYSMSLFAFPLDTFQLDEPTLDNAVDFLIESSDLELLDRWESSVIVYRAVSIAAITPQERAGIITFWIQDGLVVGFGLGTSSGDLSEFVANSWAQILNTVRPLLPEDAELSAPLYLENLGFSIVYPSDWIPYLEDSFVIFPDNSEVPTEQVVISILLQSLEDTELDEDSTPDDIVAVIEAGEAYETFIVEGEFVVLGQYGIGVSGEQRVGSGSVFLVMIPNVEAGVLTAYALAAPDEETRETYEPVFLAMLQSITPLED
jgi:hypothetical protein